MNTTLSNLSQTTAMVLAGGFGTRLQSVVADRPKPMASINDRPFLAYLLDQLHQAGVVNVVFCTGYKGDQLQQSLGTSYRGMHLHYSRETQPMGTGGALRLALGLTSSDPILALNGDSYINADLNTLLHFHQQMGATISMLLAQVPDTQRYGHVELKPDGQLESFNEKGAHRGPGLVNAGIYLMARSVLQEIPPDTAVSLERDVLPRYINHSLWGLPCQGGFIDIGTPESYRDSTAFFQDHAKPQTP